MIKSHPTGGASRAGGSQQRTFHWPAIFLGMILLAALFPAGAGAFEYGGTTGAPLAGTLTVSVVDGLNGTPVSGAWVMVGDEAGTPFAGNYGQTGPGGQIVFTNGLLSGPQTVTAAKDGYRVITIVDVDAAQVTLPLELFTVYDAGDPPLDTGVMVQGTVTNMSDVSGNVDVGIVREPLGLDWVMDFDVNALFGPAVTEYLTPAGYEGNYDLPRNVYMPSQTVPGSPAGALHRTPYMLRLPEGSVQRLFCMKGSVSLLTLLDVLGSGSIGTLLGSMAYTQFGLEDPLTVSGPGPITWPVTLDYTSFTRNLFFNVSNLPSVPSYGWPSGSTKRPFLVPVADIDIQDGTGRIVPMNLKLKLSTWAGGNEAVTVPIKTSGPMLSSNYLALVMVSAFDASDNPSSRTGLSGVFYRVPAATGSTIVFNDFYPFINVMGSQIQFPTDRILQMYWGWEVDQAGVDFVRCDLDVVAEVDCDPAVEECPVGRVREYRDTNWTVLLPGSRTGFNLPALPPGAPRALGLPVDEPGVAYTLDWKLSEYGLFHGGYVFDYDNFPFSDYREHVSQVTQRSSYITNLPNRAPDPPWNESPSAGETGVSRTPTLAGSVFNDQDADSTHAASQWQVSTAAAVNGSFASTVYDSGTDSVNLVSIVVPNGLLGVGRYYWHVRYRDNGGKWSAYSDDTWFETGGCANNGDCDDGNFCNGAETCVSNVCQPGTNPCPSDGLFCNGTESCNETTNQCTTGGNPCPSDGLFCNGTESCNESTDQCTTTGNPCPSDGLYCNGAESCNETTDQCTTTANCPANDGLYCNGTEGCNESTDQCTNTGNPCPNDGLYCNGTESCNESTDQCTNTGNPCPNDGLYCNGAESCNETSDQCVHAGDPCVQDGQFCNGTEVCNETTDQCASSGNPCPNDGLYCNGAESCNEGTDQCVHAGDPCGQDGLYCNGAESCSEATDQCVHAGSPCANDGLFCNGTESCNETTDQCSTTANCPANDGLYCNGTEGCNESTDQCTNTGNPCANDGLYCNGTEGCNETTDQCTHSGSPCADDGLFCNGAETCNEGSDTCSSSGDPCTAPAVCDETANTCVGCVTNAQCDDGIPCTTDTCAAGSCSNLPVNSVCDNGQWCDGAETCAPLLGCQAGVAPCTNDGLFCNGTEGCNESTNQCTTTGNPCPSDGQFCNGTESCNESTDQCATTGNPCPSDGQFCNGTESCNESTDQCATTGNPCPNDGLYCNGTESCNESTDQCATTGNPCPNDGLYCNGTESCNESTDQCATTGNPCTNDGLYCNGTESCIEATDQCAHSGDPCTSDGLYCNGTESCNESTDQCAHSGNPCSDTNNCTDDTCIEASDSCTFACSATGPLDACCSDAACVGEPVCEATDCIDQDGDGYGATPSPSCTYPTLADCDDSPVGDPAACATCTCGADPACAGCARCIHPGGQEISGDAYDTNCNGNNDCFIATASFGTEMTGKIDLLRDFRDRYMIPSGFGKSLVDAYYRISPPVADFIAERSWLRAVVRSVLLPVIGLVSLIV